MKRFVAILICGTLFASDASLKLIDATSSVISVEVSSSYQMSERESIEETRRHVLNEHKNMAIEYSGRNMFSSKAVMNVGGGMITSSKHYVSMSSNAATSSRIISEKINGSKYDLITHIKVDKKAASKEIERLVAVDRLIGDGLVNSSLEDENSKDLSYNRERTKWIEEFAKSVVKSAGVVCQIYETGAEYDEKIIEKYKCVVQPKIDSVDNFYAYYESDFCVEKQGGDAVSGKMVRSAVKHSISNISSNVSFGEFNAEYHRGRKCRAPGVIKDMDWVVEYSVYGFQSVLSIPIIKDGEVLKRGEFEIEFRRISMPGVSQTLPVMQKDSKISHVVFDVESF